MHRFLFLLFFLFPLISIAQDPVLTEAYSNPVLLNPAYSGGSKAPAAYLNHSNNKQNNIYNTSFLTLDIPIDKLSGGFALSLMHDRRGTALRHNSLEFSYGHSFNLGEHLTLRPGAGFSFHQKRLDLSKLTFGDQISQGGVFPSPSIIDIMPSINFLNFSSGLLLTGKKFNTGIAIHNLFVPDESHIKDMPSKLPRRYTFHGSYTFTSGKNHFTPYLVSHNQGMASFFRLGAYANRDLFSIGASYGIHNNNLSAMAGLNTRLVRIGYSFGKTSNFNYSYSTHEIYLTGTLPQNQERQKLRPANVPVF